MTKIGLHREGKAYFAPFVFRAAVMSSFTGNLLSASLNGYWGTHRVPPQWEGEVARQELRPPKEPRWDRDITLDEALEDGSRAHARPHGVRHTGNLHGRIKKRP